MASSLYPEQRCSMFCMASAAPCGGVMSAIGHFGVRGRWLFPWVIPISHYGSTDTILWWHTKTQEGRWNLVFHLLSFLPFSLPHFAHPFHFLAHLYPSPALPPFTPNRGLPASVGCHHFVRIDKLISVKLLSISDAYSQKLSLRC